MFMRKAANTALLLWHVVHQHLGVTLRKYATSSGNPLIKLLMKGVYHLRPPKPKYSSIQDTDVLLRYWEHTGDNFQLKLLELPQHVIALLVLLHGLTINATATLDISTITMSNDMSMFYPSELLRYDRQKSWRDKFIYEKI